MPVTKKRLPGGKVRVATPSGIKSKGTTPANAAAQDRLLNALEYSDWKPTGEKPMAKTPKMTMPKPAKMGEMTKPPAPKAMPPLPKGPMMKPDDMRMPMGMPSVPSMKPMKRKGTGKKGK